VHDGGDRLGSAPGNDQLARALAIACGECGQAAVAARIVGYADSHFDVGTKMPINAWLDEHPAALA